MFLWLTGWLYQPALYILYHPLLPIMQMQVDDTTDFFDPATSKLGGIAVLTLQLGVMAQLKKFFVTDRLKKFFDLLNYPVAFILVLAVLPPWPIWEYQAWANYIGGSVALAVLASVTAQKVRDAVPAEGDAKSDKE